MDMNGTGKFNRREFMGIAALAAAGVVGVRPATLAAESGHETPTTPSPPFEVGLMPPFEKTDNSCGMINTSKPCFSPSLVT